MRSVGHLGLTRLGFTPCLATASLMAARSTMAGIPLLTERWKLTTFKHCLFSVIKIRQQALWIPGVSGVILTWSPGGGLWLGRTARRFYSVAAASPRASPHLLFLCKRHHSYGSLPPVRHGWTEAAFLCRLKKTVNIKSNYWLSFCPQQY